MRALGSSQNNNNNNNNMFYSQTLLSKKGALAIIWLAAHSYRKLNKDQIFQTNIISSIERILKDEVPTVTHRILAYLLLGVVRIYSKKVEYLADECLDLLGTMTHIPKGKRADMGRESLRFPYNSITLPERFELDSFSLEGLDDQDLSSDYTVSSSKEILLADTRTDHMMGFQSYNKYSEESSSHCEVHMTTRTPVKDVLSPQFMDTRFLKMGLENIKKSMFLLDDCLEPMTFEDLEHETGMHGIFEIDLKSGDGQINMKNTNEINPSRDATNLIMGSGSINRSLFVIDDQMEPLTFEEPENQGGHNGQFQEEIQTGSNQINMEYIHERNPSRDTSDLTMGLKNINKSMFVLNDHMEPMTFEEPENEGALHGPFEKEIQTEGEQTNIANTLESRIFLMEFTTRGEAEKQLGLGSLPEKNIHTDENNSDTEIHLEGEPAAITKLVNKEKNVEAEIRQNLEVTSLESRMSGTPKDNHKSITVDVTPQSKVPAHSGVVLPEVMAVRTPAAKEHKRITQKRKCCYDDQLVLPNKMIRCWINDSSDLVSKRRKVSSTAYCVWDSQKISGLPDRFLEPLIPCNSLDFRHLIAEKAYKSGKGYQPAPSSTVVQSQNVPEEQNQTVSSLSRKQNQTTPLLFEEQNQCVPSPSGPEEQNICGPSSPEEQKQTASLLPKELCQTASLVPKVIIDASSLAEERGPAPSVSGEQERAMLSSSVESTFVGCPEFVAVQESGILEPATPVESVEKCRSPSDDETSEISFEDEEINSYEGDEKEKNYLSVRTRKVAGYLYRRFAQKKREVDEVLNLSRLVKGKNKIESAKIFYEILVLKTKDYIDVRQKNAYEDILVMQTPALKQAALVS